MKRFLWTIPALLVAAIVGAQEVGSYFQPVNVAGGVAGQAIAPLSVIASGVDAGTITASTVVNSPLGTFTVMDAGTARASVFNSYAASGSTSYSMTQSSKLCFNGIASACMEYGGGTHDIQSSVGGFISLGTLQALGDFKVRDQIFNDLTGAGCSGNTGAVCVDDAQGLAVANGSGTTGAVITSALATLPNLSIATGGVISHAAGCDSTGAPGAATCSQGAGRMAVAAAATTAVITNTLVTATSNIQCTMQETDATCLYVRACVPASGSFTVTLGPANCTADTNVAWVVVD